LPVDDPVIHRDEAVGLLFNVANIAETLDAIKQFLEADDGEEADES
jgi:hypothetical protein